MKFDALTQYLDRMDQNIVPAKSLIIYQNHRKVFEYFGARPELYDTEKDKDLYYIFSATKIITCTAVMQLVEKKLLSLDDSVAKYLPEYADMYVLKNGQLKKAQKQMQIVHLLSMTAGISYDINDSAILAMQQETNGQGTTRDVARAIAQMPLSFEPGDSFQYGLCHDVLAAVVEVVTGKQFGEYLQKNIFEPLDIHDVCFLPNQKTIERLHSLYVINPVTNQAVECGNKCHFVLTKQHESGGAGAVASVSDYIKILDALACCDDTDKGIIKKETVSLMRTNAMDINNLQAFVSKIPRLNGYGYGLGVRTHLDPVKSNSLSPVGEFGWDGAAGALAIVDPENKLSVFYAQHALNSDAYTAEIYHRSIKNIIYSALKES